MNQSANILRTYSQIICSPCYVLQFLSSGFCFSRNQLPPTSSDALCNLLHLLLQRKEDVNILLSKCDEVGNFDTLHDTTIFDIVLFLILQYNE